PATAGRVRRAFAAARSPRRSVAVGRDDLERQVEGPRGRAARDLGLDGFRSAAMAGSRSPACVVVMFITIPLRPLGREGRPVLAAWPDRRWRPVSTGTRAVACHAARSGAPRRPQ